MRLLNVCRTRRTRKRYVRPGFVLFCQSSVQCRFSLLQSGLVIARVEFDDQVTSFYLLVVSNVNLRNVAGSFRADLDDMTVNECIVSGFMRTRVKPVAHADDAPIRTMAPQRDAGRL